MQFLNNETIEKLDLSSLEAKYKGGGTSSYHPRMLLKGWVYAYCKKIYTSRKIAAALRENIHHNLGFRRFHLRGMEKVKTEWGIVSMAHNMRKMAV